MAAAATQTSFFGLASLHRTTIHTRSWIDWLAKGDTNTDFFHSHARYIKCKNFISKLAVGDRILTSEEDKDEALWEFYNSLLGTAEERAETLNLQAFHRPPINLQILDAPILEQQLWDVIQALPVDKAPGPDGFTGRFYKVCWPIIKVDLMAAIGALRGGDARKLH